MLPSGTTPARRRRRTALLALLVLAVAGLILNWWIFALSRTEQQFVGTWSIPGLPGELITFDADRTYTRHSTQPLGPPSTGYWYIEGSKLVAVHRRSRLLQRGGRIGYTMARLFDRKMANAMTEALEIVSIEVDTIRLRGSKDIELTRTAPQRPESSKAAP